MSQLLLTSPEARVIAALVEKSIATPQYYPLSVNALMLAANQKTSRNPVMSLTEGDVGAALNRLEQEKLCARDYPSGRVTKWRHQFQHQLLLTPQTLAVLVTLMLRGPQTLSELRANAAGIGGPTEPEGVAAALKDLSDCSQPLTVLLPRAPGQKEARYAHLLCGQPSVSIQDEVEAPAAAAVRPSESTVLAELEERVRALESRVAELEQYITRPSP